MTITSRPAYARPSSSQDRPQRPSASPVGQLDWPLMLAVIALCLIGAVLVWSATRPSVGGDGSNPRGLLERHLLNTVIGLALGAATSLFDYRLLRAYAPFVYLLSILGLLAVLSPLGSTINGSHSWIVLPAGFSLQPSELAKVALIVGLAMLLAERRDGRDEPRHVDVSLAVVVGALPVVLVMLQPDVGTTLVIGSMVLGVIVVAGTPMRWILGLVATAAALGFVAFQLNLVQGYQLDRFTSFLDPSADPQGSGYNVRQAQIAIGSGGLHGQGLFDGDQTQGRFVPEQPTDFIFTVAGEELGFLGAGAVISLMAVVLWRTGRIAAAADDMFGRLLATGVLCWFTFQAFENIGMTLGIMPVTGVPLPFVSYGGSSMFASLLAVGLVQNVHRRRYS